MRFLFAVLFAAALSIATAAAQAPPPSFTATGVASLSVSGSTARVALGSTGPAAILCNTGTVAGFYMFGASTVTATTSSYPVQAGMCLGVAVPNISGGPYLAGITATGTTTLSVTTGTGTISMARLLSGGGAGSCVGLAGDVTGPCSATVAQAAHIGSLYPIVEGNQTPVGGSVARIDVLSEVSSDKTCSNEAGIWPTDPVYFYWCINKEFNDADAPGTTGDPLASAMLLASNNTTGPRGVGGLIADSVARHNGDYSFAANFIARGEAGLTGLNLNPLELDLEPTATGSVTHGAGLFINAFSQAMPVSGIQLGGLSGGSFGNGFTCAAVTGACFDDTAGESGQWGAYLASGTYSVAGLALKSGATQGIEFLGATSGHNSFINTDSVDRLYLSAYGATFFQSSGFTVLRTNSVASAVNSWYLFNSSTGGHLGLQAQGETNVSMDISSKGTGTINLFGDSVNELTVSTSGVFLNTVASDAGVTDSTVCQDTTSHKVYSGAGTAGTCLGTSSKRFKKWIHAEDVDLEKMLSIKVKRFRYLEGYGDGGAREQAGFLAEDVAKVYPDLVGLDANGKPQSVDYMGFVPRLVSSVQDLDRNTDYVATAIERQVRTLFTLVGALSIWCAALTAALFVRNRFPRR